MKKTPKNTKPLTEEEREELIRLRSEIEYLKTENEVIKNLNIDGPIFLFTYN